MQAVLHHVGGVGACMAEFARVLHAGGRLVVVDGSALQPGEATQLDDELRTAGLPVEVHYGFDPEWLTPVVADAGFSDVTIRIDGRSTFATPPHVSQIYRSDRFVLIAVRSPPR